MTEKDPDHYPSNLISERYLFVEWASASGLMRRLATAHPLVRINSMTVRQYLDRAIGYLVQEGTPLREIWSLSDLVTIEAFKIITNAALRSSQASAHCMALILVNTAREWVGVDDEHMKLLNDMARCLSNEGDCQRGNLAAPDLTAHNLTQSSGGPLRVERF